MGYSVNKCTNLKGCLSGVGGGGGGGGGGWTFFNVKCMFLKDLMFIYSKNDDCVA